MIDHCSIIFQSGQMPTDMTPPVSRESAWCTLSFSWLTVTLGIQVVPDGSKVNWFGEGCLRGSDWEAEGPPWVSSVKCSPVSHTDTLLFALSTIGSSALSWKKRKKKKKWTCCLWKKKQKKTLNMSSPLFSTWAGWIQSWWKYKWDAASTEVSCFLYLLILCDRSLFFYLVTAGT